MKQTITQFIKEKLAERAFAIANSISVESEKCRQLTNEIQVLEAELEKQASSKYQDLFAKYNELILQREALMVELIYQHGFMDGLKIAKYT